MSHILTQLPVKEVIFKRCTICSEEVAQVALDALKQFNHHFHVIKLFKTKNISGMAGGEMSMRHSLNTHENGKKESQVKSSCSHGATNSKRTETNLLNF